ncbi:MAG: hypothetical protein IJR47_00530 [Clostridia bacterium]|nr:hypothetical protein [Clostridia bacterium]
MVNTVAVDIIEVSGMRRDEYAKFRGKHYLGLRDIAINGKIETLHFVTVKGKGGKVREMPLIGDKKKIERVVAFFKSLGRNELAQLHFKGLDNVGTHYRRRLYTQNALEFTRRDFEVCKKTPIYDPDKFNGKGKPKGGWRKSSVVYFRKDKAGEWEDRQAMLTVSEWLGHNRTNVMGKHYI